MITSKASEELKKQRAGSTVLFFVQIFSTLSYSILFSTLVLFITNGLKMDDVEATTITASFVAFNFALHLIGGFVAGRLFSYRSLFALGMLLQALGCYILSTYQLYLGLAVFLSGTGLNVTCINCLLTQFFKPHDKRRERAFLWNYSGMNIGFLIGFTISGFFEKTANYSTLFLIGAASNILTFIIVLATFKILKDRKTVFSFLTIKKRFLFRLFGLLIIGSIITMLIWLLRYSSFSNNMILIAGAIMVFVIIFFALRQKTSVAKEKMWAFLILCFMALCFWTLYMTAPLGLILFIENNVNRSFFGFTIPPQWALNINTVIIIIGGPLMAISYNKLRKKGFNITIPVQFTLSLFLIGLGFVLLAISINFADSKGFINFWWIVSSYILQSLGELCIGPIGYAMIGQLIPHKIQNIMMGTWMMLTGVAAVFANIFTKLAIGVSKATDPIITNPSFFKIFIILGVSTVIAGIITLTLVPFLHKLIKEKKHPSETPSIPV
ncbi:MAG: Dipeptide and tripeptide permease B [Candidatus Anoxychlamydiales bacterium]|nr:Dipeptide and tripeptide permease B [Candidatus Anoxychlamydiales bacterium]